MYRLTSFLLQNLYIGRVGFRGSLFHTTMGKAKKVEPIPQVKGQKSLFAAWGQKDPNPPKAVEPGAFQLQIRHLHMRDV